jgi:transcription initiation factor TFIIIB Brf1 subunit/transcription initiation factor TFIIB
MTRYNCPKCKSVNVITQGGNSTCCDCNYRAESKYFDRLRVRLPLEMTDKQVYSACLSYRHDFGLLSHDEQCELAFMCKEWYLAIRKELE